MMTDDEILAVVQAHKDGKQIQFRGSLMGYWANLDGYRPPWNFCEYEYRVKPELCKPREWWLCSGANAWSPWSIRENPTPGRSCIRVREVLDE